MLIFDGLMAPFTMFSAIPIHRSWIRWKKRFLSLFCTGIYSKSWLFSGNDITLSSILLNFVSIACSLFASLVLLCCCICWSFFSWLILSLVVVQKLGLFICPNFLVFFFLWAGPCYLVECSLPLFLSLRNCPISLSNFSSNFFLCQAPAHTIHFHLRYTI